MTDYRSDGPTRSLDDPVRTRAAAEDRSRSEFRPRPDDRVSSNGLLMLLALLLAIAAGIYLVARDTGRPTPLPSAQELNMQRQEPAGSAAQPQAGGALAGQ